MRVSTSSVFGRVLLGLRAGQLAGLRAQEQLSSGRRLLRPSDDPAGTARSLLLRREVSRSVRIQDAVRAGRDQLDLAGTTLQHSSELLTRARELVLQAMNGTLNEQDRETIAAELAEIRKELLDDANLQVDGTFVFGGTRLGAAPWEELAQGGSPRVVYRGDGAEQFIQAGVDARVAITAAGDQVFGRYRPGPTRFDGLTGLSSGLTADEGAGFASLWVRHDSTDPGTLGAAGIALVDGGDGDTLLGVNALTIDAAAGTIQLGGGATVTLPPAGERADVVVRNELGGELHLDLSAWSGLDFDGTVVGQGSITLDGDTFTALDFLATDLELADGNRGLVVHVDTTGVLRAGQELLAFGDTINPFDLLQGVVEDLRNDGGLAPQEVLDRLSVRLQDLDRIHDDLLVGLGTVGSRAARLASAGERQGALELELSKRLSQVEDVDLSEAALDLARADMALQVAQAAGARVIQTSLLDFMR